MKQTVRRFFASRRQAAATARELVLMQIDPEDIVLEDARGAEARSFAPADQAEAGAILRASVEPEDAQRVEATLGRNGGLELGQGASASGFARVS